MLPTLVYLMLTEVCLMRLKASDCARALFATRWDRMPKRQYPTLGYDTQTVNRYEESPPLEAVEITAVSLIVADYEALRPRVRRASAINVLSAEAAAGRGRNVVNVISAESSAGRWLKAPVRKGVGSNPTADTHVFVLGARYKTDTPGHAETHGAFAGITC